MTETRVFITAGTATQPQRCVIGDGESIDDVQASGAWLATDSPVEIKR